MSDWLLIPILLAVAAACPLHMWWQHRRSQRASGEPDPRPADIGALRARQQELSAQIAELEADESRRADGIVGG